MSRFFDFRQNNTFGRWVYDEKRGISRHVIIEADDVEEAVSLAEDIGLYFDGRGDCECCGTRWSKPWTNETGDDTPSIYGEPVGEYDFYAYSNEAECFVHMKPKGKAKRGKILAHGRGEKRKR